MISLFIFLLILGLLIIVHEFGHFILAKRLGVKVEQFSLGFGPKILSKKKNETQYIISAIPLGGYVKLAGDNLEEYKGSAEEYLSKPPRKRLAIIVCGPLLNYLLGFLCFWLIFFVGYPNLATKVGALVDGYGAQAAGIRVGDKVVAIDGQKVYFWEEMQKIIQRKKDAAKVQLSILRDNQEYTIGVEIKEKKIDDQLGQKRSVGLLGISPGDEIIQERHNPAESFLLSLNKTWELTALTYKALWRIIRGKLSVRESMAGPLGIFLITSKAADLGIIAVLHLIAVLSVSLAIFNLLPLPLLDGGHVVLLAVEKIRGKLLSLKAERIITQVGFSIIISLAVLVTYNDILRIFGDKIAKFFK